MGAMKKIAIDGTEAQKNRVKVAETLFWDKFGINNVCATCTRECKQHAGVEIVSCRNFTSNGGKIMKQKTEKRAGDAVDTVKRTRAKGFIITNVETGDKVEVKGLKKYNDETLKLENYKKLLGTINTGKPYEGFVVTKVKVDD